MKDDSQKHVTIAILQDANKMEIENAIDIANATQTSFHYTLHPLLIEIDKPKYELPNGAYDFNHAIDDLRQQPHIKKLIPRNLIFVTSLPYSDKNLVDEFQGKSLLDELNQCFFYEFYRYPQGNIALISTFIWERLPPNKHFNFPTSPSGRRAIQPYLLFQFASIALDPLADLPFHEETRGCPFDYCNDVHEIDEAFRVRRICAEHKDFLQKLVDKDLLTAEQFDSVIHLFNRAFGKVAMKSAKPAQKSKKTKIQYNFSEVNNSSIIINSPAATASVDVVIDTKGTLSQLIEIFQSAHFDDDKYKQQSLEILSSILDEVQKPEPKKFSIQAMISTLSSLISLATSIDKIAPILLDKIKWYWQ